MTLEPGQQVTWRNVPRGGYAYVMAVKATVVKVGPKRVTIDAHLQSGRKVRKVVRPENLIPESQPQKGR